MKISMSTSLLLFAVAQISAQITVTNATFPEAGDTLRLAIDNAPTGILAFTPPGGDQHWDYTSLQIDETQEIIFSPAIEGSVGGQVPGAELFAALSPTTESYYHVTPNRFELQAYYGIAPYDLAANNLFEYNPPLPERRAPLNFFDINASASGFLERFHPSAFQPLLILNLAAETNNALIDSMRYRVAINEINAVDAWGSLSIPAGTFDVLREKHTRYRETRIDAKIAPLGWLDITDIALRAGFNGLGVDTLVSFHFYNDVSKEPIAIVTVNAEQNAATQVVFKDIAGVSGIEQVVYSPSVTVSPNPAGNEAFIRFANMVPGRYRLAIFDESGRMMQETPLEVSGSNQERINLSGVLPGMYVLTLFDKKNRLVCREKLVKGGR